MTIRLRGFLIGLSLFAAHLHASPVELPATFVPELRSFLALPNDADDADAMGRNTSWLSTAFGRRGFSTQDLSGPDYALLYAERSGRDAARTLLFYLHFDGQPVDPSQWRQPNPYEAVLKANRGGTWETISWSSLEQGTDPDWRVFARSASDDKGPIVMLLHALDRLDETGIAVSSNIKVILDGKEEKGSPKLAERIAHYKKLMAADYLIVIDGPQHSSNRPTLTYGCRGIATVSILTYGPAKAAHSGHFGNVAPNPAFRLARLLASMKDDSGRVLVEGFYAGAGITEAEQVLIAGLADDTEAIKERLQVAALEKVGVGYHQALQYPSLNIRRLDSPLFGGIRTIVPDSAKAEIDIRLVPETPGARQIALLKEHMERQGFHVTEGVPGKAERLRYRKIATLRSEPGVPAFQTPADSPMGDFLRTALRGGLGISPVEVPIMGGTVPITPFIRTLDIPAVIVPLVNGDNNQHSPNENLRLGNAIEGINILVAILSQH